MSGSIITDLYIHDTVAIAQGKVNLTSASMPEDGGPILVSNLTQVTVIEGFISFVDVVGGRPVYAMSLRVLCPREPFCWLMLVGVLTAIVVNAETGEVQATIDLRRSLDDDQGFFYERCHDLSQTVVLEYEAGLLITNDGVAWTHVAKYWNDGVTVKTDRICVHSEREDGTQFTWEMNQYGERL